MVEVAIVEQHGFSVGFFFALFWFDELEERGWTEREEGKEAVSCVGFLLLGFC